MKIYFATHATTTDNETKISSGWKDVGLSKLGVKQAKEMGERFKDIKIDLICYSDLKRAINTVKIAFGDKYPVIIDKRLRECNYGDFNGKPWEIVEPMRKEKIKEPFPNGESYEQVVARVQDFYHELKEKYPEKTVLVIGHRATQYGLDTLVGGKTIEECLNTPFKWQPYWEYNLWKIILSKKMFSTGKLPFVRCYQKKIKESADRVNVKIAALPLFYINYTKDNY